MKNPKPAAIPSFVEMERAARIAFQLEPQASVVLINHSENATFRVDEPLSGHRSVVRVYRENTHTPRRIESELVWMRALAEDIALPTPTPIATPDGSSIAEITGPTIGRRFCVRFEFLEGDAPRQDDLRHHMEALGHLSARMHAHVETWRAPAMFERLNWDFTHALGTTPNWGDWRNGPALDTSRTQLLQGLVDAIETRLAAYGGAPHRFGLIHADMRLANLIVQRGDIRIIDFDDCGTGWFLYDLATVFSFIEERPDVAALIKSWIAGYETVRRLSPEDRAEIPTFLMVRRMVILAWIGSHAETDLARELGPAYTAGTCRLAERFLAQEFLVAPQ